jgi:hypothetical protein
MPASNACRPRLEPRSTCNHAASTATMIPVGGGIHSISFAAARRAGAHRWRRLGSERLPTAPPARRGRHPRGASIGATRARRQERDRVHRARARWPVDADGAEDNHPAPRRTCASRTVVALRSLSCRAQVVWIARCTPVHRAHRPYRRPGFHFRIRNGLHASAAMPRRPILSTSAFHERSRPTGAPVLICLCNPLARRRRRETPIPPRPLARRRRRATVSAISARRSPVRIAAGSRCCRRSRTRMP